MEKYLRISDVVELLKGFNMSEKLAFDIAELHAVTLEAPIPGWLQVGKEVYTIGKQCMAHRCFDYSHCAKRSDERIVLVGRIEEVILSKGGEVSCTAVFPEYDSNGCVQHVWEQTFVPDDFDVWLFHDISKAHEKLTRVADETVMLPWWLL